MVALKLRETHVRPPYPRRADVRNRVEAWRASIVMVEDVQGVCRDPRSVVVSSDVVSRKIRVCQEPRGKTS